jgi:hemoglobin
MAIASAHGGAVIQTPEHKAMVRRQDQVPATSLYERLGGMEFFESLARRFYEGVAGDPVLRPLYAEDLEGPRQHLSQFLAQFWGGPRDYERDRGNPRLRARHLPFKIGPEERDRWLHHMTAAVKAADLRPLEELQLLEYFRATAEHLVNTA